MTWHDHHADRFKQKETKVTALGHVTFWFLAIIFCAGVYSCADRRTEPDPPYIDQPISVETSAHCPDGYRLGDINPIDHTYRCWEVAK